MFIRRKPNKSGSTSVQVVVKTKDRRQRIVKSLGVGHTESELLALERQGQDYIASLSSPMIPGLLENDNGLEEYLSTIQNSQIQVIGPELVFGALYDRMGYSAIDNAMFRHLVICRLYNPGSKLKTVDYLASYLHVTCSVDKIYRFLDELCLRADRKASNGCETEGPGEKSPAESPEAETTDLKARVEQITFEHTRQLSGGDIAVCFYDMTTLYFEAAEEDELRRYGFSKDGKNACPQIFLGLLVSAGGNPIGYEIFEGNTAESKTLIPMIRALAAKFGFGLPVVVADSGLLTRKNMEELTREGYQYILGAKPKNDSRTVKDKILALKLSDGMVAELDKGNGMRLIVSCSDKRARKDAYNRKRGLTRLEKNLGSGKLTKQNINNRGYNKYLKMEGDVTISIDMDKYNRDAAWDGIKGYVTNTELPAREVIEKYSNLWYIERAFRFNKSDLAVRPIYHRLRNRIEGHICICFTAYAILLELERILKAGNSKLTVYSAQELTRSMYALNCELPYTRKPKRIILGMSSEQQELYDLVIHPPKDTGMNE